VSDGVLGVSLLFREDIGGGEGGDDVAKRQESVAVGREGVGFGVIVAGSSGRVWGGQSSERCGRLGEEVVGGGKNAVVIDDGDVGACGSSGDGSLRGKAAGEEKGCSLRTEESARCGHVGDLGRKSITKRWR
jgi:hypothetical protein